MIEDLLRLAVQGDAARARETARTLRDPGLLPAFHEAFAGKLSWVERKSEPITGSASDPRSRGTAAFGRWR
jgi:hypothetical protein